MHLGGAASASAAYRFSGRCLRPPPAGCVPGVIGLPFSILMRALKQRSGKCFFTRMSARVACRKGRSPTTLEWYSFGGGRGS